MRVSPLLMTGRPWRGRRWAVALWAALLARQLGLATRDDMDSIPTLPLLLSELNTTSIGQPAASSRDESHQRRDDDCVCLSHNHFDATKTVREIDPNYTVSVSVSLSASYFRGGAVVNHYTYFGLKTKTTSSTPHLTCLFHLQHPGNFKRYGDFLI